MSRIDLVSTTKFNKSKKITAPFVAMTPFHRVIVVGVLTSYLLLIGVQGLDNAVSNTEASLIFIALALNIALLLVPIIFFQPSYGWFHPLIFHSLFTVITHVRRLGLYVNGLQWHAALPSWSSENLNHLVVYELLLRALGLIAMYFSFWMGPAWSIPKITFKQPSRLIPKTLLVVTFSTVVFLAYMQTRGGIIAHILSWGQGRNTALAGQAYWPFFIKLGLNACLLWLATDRKAETKPIFWGVIGVSLISNFVASGSRAAIVYYMAMAVIVWLLREQKIAFTKIITVMTVGVLILGLLGNLRSSTFDGEIDWRTLTGASSSGETSLLSGLTEITERAGSVDGAFPIIAKVPAEEAFLYGDSYLAVLTLPIPRKFWPNKPGLVGGRIGDVFFGLSNVGMPGGALGEAYWNFGVLGVMLAYLLFGFFYRWLAESFLEYSHDSTAIVLYVVILFNSSAPDGSAIVASLIELVPLIIFFWMIGAISFRRFEKN